MIRVSVIVTKGYAKIEVIDHATSTICSAASALMVACALGLKSLASYFPSQVRYEEAVKWPLEGKKRVRRR